MRAAQKEGSSVSAYLTEFENRGDVEKEYKCKIPEDCEILLAWYGYGSYCGDSFVLYRQSGKLYEVNGSHCSCYGLEGQWDPEETTVAALRMRKIDPDCGEWDKAQKQLTEVLDRIESESLDAG